MKIPSDLQILQTIYEVYYDEYKNFIRGSSDRESKIYVPIDCKKIADRLNVDSDIVFGRLYYYLEHRYAYTQSDGAKVHFFALKVGQDNKCINFPYLASVLAGLQIEHNRFKTTLIVSIFALFFSLISLVVSGFL